MLSLNDLGHRFDDAGFLFRHLTVRIEPGEVVAVVGPSGSGKTTLLSIVAGRTAPTEGQVCRHSTSSQIAWAFQNPFGVPGRTALDHVALAFMAKGMNHQDARQRAYAELQRFEVDYAASQRFGSLSGGEAQRVLLARVAAIDAPLALIDEPTAQLDFASASTVVGVISELASPSTALLIATHDDRVRAACSREIRLGGPQ